MKKILVFIFALIAMASSGSAQDSEPDYLCFEVEAGTTISLETVSGQVYPSIYYLVEGGQDWKYFNSLTVEKDCRIYFMGSNPNGFNRSRDDTYSYFKVSKKCKCSGNIMTLIDCDGKTDAIPNNYCFYRLFYGCPITTAPDLPATTLTEKCYFEMFYGCESLAKAPQLPATSLAKYCYGDMFAYCTSLTTAPELPAMTLAQACYCGMFEHCTSLTVAPELPATVLVRSCYFGMFDNCTNLTQAPVLSATSLAQDCYAYMFQDCKNLRNITVAFHSWTVNNKNFTSVWVSNASSNGTFICPPDLPQYFGDRFIPDGWTVVYSTDDNSKSISTDDYSQTDKSKAQTGDVVNVTFIQRNGYNLTSATFNSTALSISNYKSSFAMPSQDVEIKTVYTPIEYTVTCADNNVSVNKIKATIADRVTFTIANRTSDGYKLDKVTINDQVVSVSNYTGSFEMKDYLSNVTIMATYSKSGYTITTDSYSTADKLSANSGDKVNVNFTKRDGYNLTSATFNGTTLTISDYKSSFTMPAANVEIKTIYTPIKYTITTDGFAQVNKTSATANDNVNVTFTKRDGYNLTSATYNGTALSVSDYKSSFTMPAANVEIKTVYTPIDYSKIDYLCFEVKAGTTVLLKKVGNANPNIQYSFDKKTWSDFSELTVDNDCCIYFKGVNPSGLNSYKDYASFDVSKEFKCCGNVMSLIDGVGEMTAIPNGSECCFYRLFAGCPLTTAPELPATTLAAECYLHMFYGCTNLTTTPELPATTLTISCYCGMFYGCTRLTAAPKLPATTLATYCYKTMFYGCTSLTTAPELPATTLAIACYDWMFGGCTSLTTAPELPATTLAISCYHWMFSGCTSLTIAPRLPATTLAGHCYGGMFQYCTGLTSAPELYVTTLASYCYSEMFSGCTSLITAPELPATTLAERCYNGMFSGCTNLNKAPELPATTLAEGCYRRMFAGCTRLQSITVALNSWTGNGFERWVSGVSDKGIFICPSDLPQQFGENYIPEGWIVNPQSKNFAISSSNQFVTIDKTSAKYNDKVTFSVVDRTSAGYKLVKVLVDNIEVAVSNYAGSFDMMDYLSDVTITAQYSKIPYTITTDEYSQVANTTATVDDAITVTFKQREGFDLTSATCNGNPLNIKDYKATFTMPAQDVEIKAVYTEKVYEIEKPSEGVSVSQPSAKAGDEITISVNPKDGYTVHLYVNGAEVALSGNSAVYTMPSGKIEITVKYVVEEKTPVSEIELDNCAVSVFPNPAKSGEEITLKIGGKFDMNNAKIYLYNASGSLVMQIDNVKEYNQLTLRSGVYVGVLVTKGGKKTFRVAVK